MGIFNGAWSGCMLHIWLVSKKGCRRGYNLEGEDKINSSLKDACAVGERKRGFDALKRLCVECIPMTI